MFLQDAYALRLYYSSIVNDFLAVQWHDSYVSIPIFLPLHIPAEVYGTAGTHIRPSHVVDEFKKLLSKAGLPDIRFHDLRRSAATLLLSLGAHPKVVQEMLGHTQITMTMDIYSHVLPSMQQDAVSRLNELAVRMMLEGLIKAYNIIVSSLYSVIGEDQHSSDCQLLHRWWPVLVDLLLELALHKLSQTAK